MNKNSPFLGEASESDEEFINTEYKILSLALEAPGEISDSDEGNLYDKTLEDAEECKPDEDISLRKNNLLQSKLIETNVSIWNNMNKFVKNFVASTTKELRNTDRLMINSEVTVQTTLSSLKRINSNMERLNKKCNMTFTDNFISNIIL